MILYTAELESFSQDEYSKYFAMMSDERKSAIERMRIENDKKRSVLGESLARRGISSLCGISEQDIEFSRDERGKPFCLNANAFFSISHSKERVICAVGNTPLGADTEKIRFTEARVMRMCCLESDAEYILGNSRGFSESVQLEEEMLERFFALWTAKEAYCKYTGVGVSGMKSISLSDIMPNCKILKEDRYITAVYCENPDFELEIVDLRRCE